MFPKMWVISVLKKFPTCWGRKAYTRHCKGTRCTSYKRNLGKADVQINVSMRHRETVRLPRKNSGMMVGAGME